MTVERLEEIGPKNYIVPASKLKRLVNYLVDSVLYTCLAMFLAIILGVDLEAINSNQEIRLVFNIVLVIGMVGYYILFETLLKGKSPAKFITGTRVVKVDGNEPDLDTIAKRSLCRAVPFEAFSFLSSRPDGWHDRWSGTIVIDERISDTLLAV